MKRQPTIYTPDRWIVIKFPDGDKVLGGWTGGYMDTAHWRMNSGIKTVEDKGDTFDFHGYSGSIYRCRKTGYGCTAMSAGVLQQLLEQYPGSHIHPDYKHLDDEL